MFQNKNTHKRLAMTLGGIIGAISIGTIITIATLDTTKEIPDNDPGTIGYALSKIIQGDWQNNSVVNQSKQLGGVNGEQFLRMTSTYGCILSNQVLRRISPDGIQNPSDCVSLPVKRSRPILATLRDLDSSCFGTTITNTGTYTDESGNQKAQRTPQILSIKNSDPIDLYEDDAIQTTAGCSLASLYMPDNSIIRLNASTKITLRYAGIPGGSGATSTDLDGGEMWARVLKPITDDSYFNVNTQEASVGVRGTSVWISRDSTAKKTTALPIDSGKLKDEDITNNSGAIVVYPKHGDLTALGTPVPLTHTITVDLDGKSQLAPYPTSTTTQIYKDKPFVRMATLADIKDFTALRNYVGNLATIQATKSDLTSTVKDLYDGGEVGGYGKRILAPTNDSIIDTEIDRTLPSDSNEERELCSSKKWWDAVPLGRENCIESNISFLADYSKNDQRIYSPLITVEGSVGNLGTGTPENGGIKIEGDNKYIQYALDDHSILSGRKITISLQNEIPTGGSNKYILDLGGSYYKVFRKSSDGIYQCAWRTDQKCELTPGWVLSSDKKTITIQIPTQLEVKNNRGLAGLPPAPNQLIFGAYKDLFDNSYKGQIGSTIQSIYISPAPFGG